MYRYFTPPGVKHIEILDSYRSHSLRYLTPAGVMHIERYLSPAGVKH